MSRYTNTENENMWLGSWHTDGCRYGFMAYLHECCEALVQVEIVPPLHGNKITKPLVAYFMRNQSCYFLQVLWVGVFEIRYQAGFPKIENRSERCEYQKNLVKESVRYLQVMSPQFSMAPTESLESATRSSLGSGKHLPKYELK